MSPQRPTPPARVVDARGRACPIPVIELAKAVGLLDVGEVVHVLSDDPASEVDIPVWCRMQRQAFLGRDDEPDGGVRYRVEKRRATG